MTRSTPQPIPARSSYPARGDQHSLTATQYTANTHENTTLDHASDGEVVDDDGILRNLTMGLGKHNLESGTPGPRAPLTPPASAQPYQNYYEDHSDRGHTLNPKNYHAELGVVDPTASGMDSTRESDQAYPSVSGRNTAPLGRSHGDLFRVSHMPKAESGIAQLRRHHRPSISIDTSPANLQHAKFGPLPAIRGYGGHSGRADHNNHQILSSSGQAGHPRSGMFAEQAMPSLSRTWTPTSSAQYSQLSLFLSKDKGLNNVNAPGKHPVQLINDNTASTGKALFPSSSSSSILSTSLSPSLSLSSVATSNDTSEPTVPSMPVAKSSLTWTALPPLPEPTEAPIPPMESPDTFTKSVMPRISHSFIPDSCSYNDHTGRLQDTCSDQHSMDDSGETDEDRVGSLPTSIPINRPYRSKSVSSYSSHASSLYSSLGGNSLDNINGNSRFNNQMRNMVTSSSYSSLPYSPAVAFLSNFVDSTAPRLPPDEEGSYVGNYIMGKVIGHGGFSVVREATIANMDEERHDGRGIEERAGKVAVKIVKTQTGATDNDRVQKMLNKEITIWSQISHPNVLPFIGVEKLPTDTFIFCELCTGGHLLQYLTRHGDVTSATTVDSEIAPTYPLSATAHGGLDEEQARIIFNQVAEAVRYLHEEKRIVHRDIKLENILRHQNGTWKICDFGLAEYQDEEAAACFGDTLVGSRRASRDDGSRAKLSPACGGDIKVDGQSLGWKSKADENASDSIEGEDKEDEEDAVVGGSLAYCSPEQLRCDKPLRCPLSDVWSLGVVLYALLTGRLPFQDEYEPRLQLQILHGRYEELTDCSAEARDLLKHMFKSKLEERWQIGRVKDSPWCMGIDGIVLDSVGRSDINSSSSSRSGMAGLFSSFRSTL